jgi:hypothetical protein
MTRFATQLRCFSVALAALLLVVASPTARAGTIAYSMTLCEDLGVMLQPNNQILAQNAAMKSQHVLMVQRTNPYFELRNTGTEDAQITHLTMSIGDTSKNFDWAGFVQASPGVTFTVQSPDAIAGAVKSDMVTITFSGFDPGDFVRFRVGLSPDSASASSIVDYRSTLFQMNGSSSANNSTVGVRFQNSTGSEVLSRQMPDFVNTNPFTSTNLNSLNTICGMDSIVPFTFTDNGIIPPPVPEPGTFVLFGIGLMGLSIQCWRRRRAH